MRFFKPHAVVPAPQVQYVAPRLPGRLRRAVGVEVVELAAGEHALLFPNAVFFLSGTRALTGASWRPPAAAQGRHDRASSASDGSLMSCETSQADANAFAELRERSRRHVPRAMELASPSRGARSSVKNHWVSTEPTPSPRHSNGHWSTSFVRHGMGMGESHSHTAPALTRRRRRGFFAALSSAGSTTSTTFSASPATGVFSFLTLQLPPSSKQWTWFFFSGAV